MVAGQFLIAGLLRSQPEEVVNASRVFLFMIPAGMLSAITVATLQGRGNFLKLNTVRLILPLGYVLGLAGLAFVQRPEL